ncbi:MAG: hypothetical protein QHJ73_09990, partial [Armatimonadota bacterium]|nr:hypothetical protein [Armatimonadota bacterium]
WGQPARVRARVEEGNKVVVNATNVARYQLNLPAALAEPSKPLQVWTNGAREVFSAWKPGRPVVVELEKGEAGLQKTATLCGPVREVFLSPFLLVPGTKGDEASRAKLHAWAERWAAEWSAFADGVPAIRPDHALTEADLNTHNLVLFGDRHTNQVLARMADALPVELTTEGYRLNERKVQGTALGLLMVYPNPLAPQRLVCVYSGEFWGDGLDVNHKFDLVPDFIVFRNELDGDDPARTPRAVCAGYFDSRWRVSRDLTWEP